MTAPKVYKYTDGNAPVLRGERGALVALLDACLVDGYGDKDPLGFTQEYLSANEQKAAFRNDSTDGTGFFLRVNEDSSSNAYTPNLIAYELMTDIDNGSNPFPTVEKNYHTISFTADDTPRPWVLIGNEFGFYMAVWSGASVVTGPTKSDKCELFYFGDFISPDSDDSYNCLLGFNGLYQHMGMTCASDPTSHQFDDTYPAVNVARPANAYPASYCFRNLGAGGGPCFGAYSYSLGNAGGTYEVGTRLYLTRPYIPDASNYTLRGWLPGYYAPCQCRPFEPMTIVEDDGKSYLVIAGWGYSSSYHFEVMIDLSDTYWPT